MPGHFLVLDAPADGQVADERVLPPVHGPVLHPAQVRRRGEVLRARGVFWSFFSTASGQTDNLFLKHLYDLDLVPARDPRNSMQAVRGTYKLSCDESRSAEFVICSMFSSCSKFFDSPDHTF